METQKIRGVIAPVVTPFDDDLRPDAARFVAHCRWLISQNCGLAVFGTNSEGNSLSVDEKLELLDQLFAAGVDMARMMPGTGCCALPDTVRLTAHAVKAGAGGVLMLPPFYYKNVSEEGLYRSYSEVIQRVGESNLRIYLYHIPQVAGVGIPVKLIERLLRDYPVTIAGIKDSSGDWSHTEQLLNTFRGTDFDVFVGSESFLLTNMQNGGAGCISATANVNPAAIDRLYQNWENPEAASQQKDLDDVRRIVGRHGMIQSLKAVIAHFSGRPEWRNVRPPLDRLTDRHAANLISELDSQRFTMPGVRDLGWF
jgi:4-hydroxy-tetrahydrodipicolinate synthase